MVQRERHSKRGSTSQFPQSTNCPRRHPAGWSITTRVAITLRWSSAPPASHFTGLADRPEGPPAYSSASFPKWELRRPGRKPADFPRRATRGETPPQNARPRGRSRPWPSCGDRTLELHAKPRKKTWKDDERQYNKYLPTLHDKRLSAITQAIVAKWHGTIAKEHGPIQANRCKALLATMFSKASAAVGYTGPNPAVGVANFPERSRERFLLPAEMKAFFTALAAEDVYWQAFFLLCLFTGSRRGNVAAMEWPEIDLENAVWHIPGNKTKNKRPTTISLCAPALAILKTRHEQRNGSPYVFPAFKGDGHLSDPRKSWDRILTAMRTCPKCNRSCGAGGAYRPQGMEKG